MDSFIVASGGQWMEKRVGNKYKHLEITWYIDSLNIFMNVCVQVLAPLKFGGVLVNISDLILEHICQMIFKDKLF